MEHSLDHRYHHGNVRQALVDAAMALMSREPLDQLSLRRLAREVGVTPSAVYNHFPDKGALLLAVRARAFTELNDYFDSVCDPAIDPEDGLLQMCLAYYRFAESNPTQFSILFGDTAPVQENSPDLQRLSCRTIGRLRELMAAICRKYELNCDESTLVQAVLLTWAQMHGLVVLKVSGSLQVTFGRPDWPGYSTLPSDDHIRNLLREMVKQQVAGMLASQRRTSRLQ